MNKPKAMGIVALASLAILGGCTTMGTGEGDLSRNNGKNQRVTPVKFAWKSTDGGAAGYDDGDAAGCSLSGAILPDY